MSVSSFCIPSAVFSSLASLSGPVAVVGSRQLPLGALQSVARLGRWLGRGRRPLWSGGALGADSAGSAGCLAQSGFVRWWLPVGCSQLPRGSSSPVVRGPAGVFPLSSPRTLARSISCVPWAGGPASASFGVRLLQRSRILLLSLQSAGGGSVVAFIGQQALGSRRGGTWFTVRQALGLGFVPGSSLSVVVVGPSGFQFMSAASVQSTFSAPASSQLSLFSPQELAGAGPAQFGPVSSSGSRRDPHGERYNSQTVSGPLSQAFWLGLCLRQ